MDHGNQIHKGNVLSCPKDFELSSCHGQTVALSMLEDETRTEKKNIYLIVIRKKLSVSLKKCALSGIVSSIHRVL